MQDRFIRMAAIWLLALATAYVAEPYLLAFWFSATSPRAITPRGPLSASERNATEIFKAVSPSVAHIFAATTTQHLFSVSPPESVTQSGSGFVWDAAGHVVTNYHVIAGADRIGAKLSSGEAVSARVVGVAPNYDLAVLQLERLRTPVPPIPVGSSRDLQVGQKVYAIGNPYGLDQSLTSGIISALKRRLPTGSGYEISGVIQTDAAINPGNSGGPLLDDAGRLIGVNSAIVSGSGASAGIGFAIPVDAVNQIVAQLIKEGRAPAPGIGIVAASEDVAARLGVDGVIIVRTQPNSPAQAAGLVGADDAGGVVADVITAANGEAVHSISDLAAIVQQVGIGGKVTLTVERGAVSRTVQVNVADVSRHKAG